jgi:hypothetical protein
MALAFMSHTQTPNFQSAAFDAEPAVAMHRYQGTGKQFFIGMWEGDHALRKPGNLGHHVPPDVGRMETIQFVVQEKQRAVDNAKKAFGDTCQNVRHPGVCLLCVHGSENLYV